MAYSIADAIRDGWNERAAEFVAWRKQVDRKVIRLSGLSVDDLPDADFASAFEDGVDAEAFALEVLEEAGFPVS